MNKIFKIAGRDYNASVRTKGFIFGLIIAPIFMCGSLIAFVLLKDRVDTTDKVIAVIDRSGVVADHLMEEVEKRNASGIFDKKSGDKIKPAYLLKMVEPDGENPDDQLLALSNRVRSKDLFAFVEIGSGVVSPNENPEQAYIKYYSESSALSDERRWMESPINTHLRFLRGTRAGLEEDTFYDLIRWINVAGLGLVSVDKKSGEVKGARRTNEGEALGAPLAMTMMMFLMMMMGAMPLLGTVMEEKGQRIYEVLLGSISPFGLMMGKVLGGVAVSLTALVLYVLLAAVGAEYFEIHDYIPYQILPWLFLYMIAAIFMFGSLFAAIGAACNDQKEAQSLMPLVMLPMLIPMFVLVPVIKEPLSGFSTFMSLFPPFTPMMMLLRQASPVTIPAWQPWVGLVGIVATTLFCVWAGGRIFRVGVLLQGQAPKVRQLVKWVLKG